MDEATRLQRHLPLFRACAGWTAKNFAELLEVSRQTVMGKLRWKRQQERRQAIACAISGDKETA